MYEATRRWGDHASKLQVWFRWKWNRWVRRHGGGDLCCLRLIALEHGLAGSPH
jgi:hypothetical protein